ncbi:MAG: DNA alkylation repair protein [Saprospiraceae bacterium]|nr:DNA alkylation repair protein [Saprospiraceae bacterium]
MNEYTRHIFYSHSDPLRAASMKAYMKNLFPFIGINAPLRTQLISIIYKHFNVKSLNLPWVTFLWKENEREFQYAALDHLKKFCKYLKVEDLPFIEKLITTKSWWDTVDALACHQVGFILKNNPNLIDQNVSKWLSSDNIWLNRTAILFQLKYKKETNFPLLCECILTHISSKEFFIQKASGWALREYAKTDPVAVKQFVEANPELAGLTKREALKHIR